MITIGVDAHKRVHVAVALNAAGQVLEQWRGPNTLEGWQALRDWAQALGRPRRWGIEGAWNYGRGLAQHLVAGDEVVYDINPRWTAKERGRARRTGKTDRLDAHAVALLVWREEDPLPQVATEDETAVLEVLVTERENALAEATRLRNQLHQLLLQIDPEYRTHLPHLQSKAGLPALETYTAPGTNPSPVQQAQAAAVRRLAQRLRLAIEQAAELAEEIKERAQAHFSPLTKLCGVNLLTAGALAGLLGPGRRFPTNAHLAAYAGVAPLEASSAERVRHRLNRGGNRRLNAILYRIALTQARYAPQARAYLDRRVAEGKTRREALRALKRYLIRAIWRLWQECLPAPAGRSLPHAA
jgi:transposase